jgi:hypothetical protein
VAAHKANSELALARTVPLHAGRRSVRPCMSSPAFRGQDETSIAVASGRPYARDNSGNLAGAMARQESRSGEVHTEVHTALPNTLILPDWQHLR